VCIGQIKRNCDKETVLSHRCLKAKARLALNQKINQGTKTKHKPKYFFEELLWSLKPVAHNCLFIAILCAKSSVKKA